VAKQKSGLGRGLDALISGASDVISAQQASRLDSEIILQVPVDSIIPNPRQPRRIFRDDDPQLLELTDSIRIHGLLQPIVVTRLNSLAPTKETYRDDNSWFTDDEPTSSSTLVETAKAVQYQIIAGERRWRASRQAGLTKVPTVIKEATPRQMLELALIENLQRADLNPIEEALAYQSLLQEFGLTQEMVAKQVGKDRSTITNALRLLQLAPKVREALINQPTYFSEGHARALVGIASEEDQITAMSKIIALRLNVRQAEELAARMKAAQDVEAAAQQVIASRAGRHSPEDEDLETQFRHTLMVKVDLKRNAKGKGTIVLHFNNEEELERLYTRIVKHIE
jgi:ParB family transcriptional regulator, chromosome partitioning protein